MIYFLEIFFLQVVYYKIVENGRIYFGDNFFVEFRKIYVSFVIDLKNSNLVFFFYM